MFIVNDQKARGLIIINVFMLSVFFPMFSIFLMKMLDFIKSYKMEDKTERIGPLIATGVFYLWMFVNFKGNSTIPVSFSSFVLGSTIGLFLALMLNSFTKVSLHTIAAGGLVTGLLFIKYLYSYETFFVSLPFGSFQISTTFVTIVAMIIAGLVGTSRLLLKAHDEFDVYGGYIVGIFSMIVAFKIMG
ncbi:MAG: membrane-associated phospholipid phosphatase [Saprospiraceae bacterium]|jgi:membrane-associated phospholipid phosphatase|tara:strand:- start:4614 stop:5177 length:564 start_codon:yes stop_codon:yes gene_type:complete